MTKTYSKTRTLVECALMIAIGTVLAQIKVFEMPNGGSVTLLSMLPFVLVSFRHGVKWGLFTGFVNSLLQMLLGFYAPPSNTVWALVGMIMLDYVLAFSCLGLACVFAKPFKNKLLGVAVGTAAVCFLRFLCSYMSTVFICAGGHAGLAVRHHLQRRLYAARADPHDGGRGAAVPLRPRALLFGGRQKGLSSTGQSGGFVALLAASSSFCLDNAFLWL